MSAKDTMQGNNNNADNNKRTPLSISVDAEPFNAIAATKYVTSNDICKYAAELFKSIFADCEGTRFDVIGYQPTISVIINHGIYDKDAIVACRREADINNNSNSSVLQRVRNRDRLLANGDRYFITEDGKDIFTPLVSYQVYNNGKPNWGKVVGEYNEGNRTYYGYTNQTPYTKIGFVDIGAFSKIIWGKKDSNGEPVEYDANIVRALNSGVPGMPPSNYMLAITRVSAKELQNTYEKLGFGSFSNIIR